MKIKLPNNNIVEVRVKKEFTYEGVALCIHRPHGQDKSWACGEKNTGLMVGYICSTMDKTMQSAKNQIDAAIEKGIDIAGLIAKQEKLN